MKTSTTHFDYLIVGGGMAAHFAAEGIRERDGEGSIGILSEDVDAPYPRPALTKTLWTDHDFTWADAEFHTAQQNAASIFLDTAIVSIDREAQTVTSRGGTVFHYDALLLATGGRPTRVALPDDERVIWFHTALDYRRLREIAARHSHVAIVGGGYLSSELAAALVDNGCEVTLAFPEEVLGAAVFPAPLARRLHERFVEHGVRMRPGSRVASGSADDDGVEVRFQDGTSLRADAVVSGLGIKPNVELARDAGLMTADGVVVDEHLRTSDPRIFAAGDVAEYPDVLLGRRRVEHVDNATAMGHTAGHNMAGDPEPYDHTPYYYSVLFGTRYEAVGTLDATMQTVEDWSEPLESGVIYYLCDGLVQGVLLWNIENRLDEARQVIAEARAITVDDLRGLIRT